MKKPFEIWQVIILSVFLALCLCLSSGSYLFYARLQAERTKVRESQATICQNLIDNDLMNDMADCRGSADPHEYLPIIFPSGAVDKDFVAVAMQDFELHEVYQGGLSGCEHYVYEVFDFIFHQYFDFYFCDSRLKWAEYQD